MKIFDIFRRFKKQEPELNISGEEPLPSDLEKFRIRKGPIASPTAPLTPYQAPKPIEMSDKEEESFYGEVPERISSLPPRPELPEVGPTPKTEVRSDDKIDMVLQRLEIIDTRLKLIEERTRK